MGLMSTQKQGGHRPQLITEADNRLIQAVENGLPICHRPYRQLAQQLGCTEQAVIARLRQLIDCGLIKRFGVVVRHRELGYRANGMVVWDVPDAEVSHLGRRIAEFSCVTLSYRRPRRLPEWPYNLFTMVHGHNREQVIEKVAEIVNACALHHIAHEILFSTRRFKQRGASYRRAQTPGLEVVGP
jgi:DNA-binding Lrp family transcriptional regulator